MLVFGRRIEEREGASVFRDCREIILVEFVELAEFFGGRPVGEKCVAGFGVLSRGSVVSKFGLEASAKQEDGGFITSLFCGPLFWRDAGRLFVVGRAAYVFDDARGISYGTTEGGFVAGLFKELDGEEGDRHVLGREGDKPLGVRCGFGSVAELQVGFDEGAEDLWAFSGLRVFQEKVLKVANKSSAVVAGGFDGLLEFVGGRKLLGHDGLFGGGGRILRRGLREKVGGQQHEERSGGKARHLRILYECEEKCCVSGRGIDKEAKRSQGPSPL